MRAIFGNGHAAIADFEHVGIIPMARTSEGFEADLQVKDIEHSVFAAGPVGPFFLAGPFVADVSGSAPQIADAFAQKPGFGGAPLADAEDDGPPGREQSRA